MGRGSRSRESGRQTVRRKWCIVFGVFDGRKLGRRWEGGREKGMNQIEFVEEQCFTFGVKELWRDSKK